MAHLPLGLSARLTPKIIIARLGDSATTPQIAMSAANRSGLSQTKTAGSADPAVYQTWEIAVAVQKTAISETKAAGFFALRP